MKSLLVSSSYENYVLKYNLSLLHKAVLGLGSLEVKLLLEEIPSDAIDEKNIDGQTALYWAALRGDT